MLKKSGLTRRMLEVITDGPRGDMFLSFDLLAYIMAKGLLEDK